MRSIEDIRDTGAAWVTEAELAMLCAFAKRAEAAEATLAEAQRNCAILPAVVERKAVLEAVVVRLREDLFIKTAEWTTMMEENKRLRSVPDELHRPDVDHLRGLEGDQTEVDRYWMGWTDALDQVSVALRGSGK